MRIVLKNILPVLPAFLSLAFCVSCQKPQESFYTSEEIGVLTQKGGPVTKGSGELSTESLRTRSFGLYGYYRDAGEMFDGVDTGHELISNSSMSFVETESGGDRWVCNPTVYWPFGCTMTFFAYAPYLADGNDILTLPNSDGNPMLRGTFDVPSDPSEQPDFCLSAPVLDWSVRQGDVPVNFNHALTQVRFYFNLKGTPYQGDYRVYRVKEMTVEGLVGSNKFTYGGTNGWSWEDLPRNNMSLRTASYDLSLADGTLEAVDLPYRWDRDSAEGLAKYEWVNCGEDGVLYLLPQPLTSAASVTVQLAAYMDDGTGNWVEDTRADIEPLVASLPEATVWHAGDVVCYSASIDMSWHMEIEFTVTVTPWEDASSSVDIPAERVNTAEFSVSDSKKVRFSTGNLQAVLSGGKIGSDGYSALSWRFARHQYSLIGNGGGNVSLSAGGVVDLFGWVGASAEYNTYGICSNASTGNAWYGTVADEALKTDWGSIPSLVSSLGTGWRSLTSTEFAYIIGTRATGITVNGTSDARYTLATVNTDGTPVMGLLLFPDGYSGGTPSGVVWGAVNAASNYATTCTAAGRTALEAAGCVFLPAGGSRLGTTVSGAGVSGYYRTATAGSDGTNATELSFGGEGLSVSSSASRCEGHSVRLVRDVQ